MPRTPIELEPDLTERQLEILKRTAKGMTAQEIANEMTISRRTVEYHKQMVMLRLRLRSTAALALYASAHGLI